MARKDQISSTIDRQEEDPPDERVTRREPPLPGGRLYVRVGKRGQIVLPASIRRKLGIEDGSRLAIRIDSEGKIVLRPVSDDPLQRLRDTFGSVYAGVDVEEYIRELREEWDPQ